MLIDIIAGARPNFMKVAPLIREITIAKNAGKPIDYRLIHTGQHYDQKMSGSFFQELQIPEPHLNFEIGSGTQAEQTGRIMAAYEALLQATPSDLCIVVGDVNSTMACSISAKKSNIPVAHIEAGIRSGDRTMPEEINRLVTDAISDFYFTTTDLAGDNLIKEGIAKEKIFLVGNTMIDTLLFNLDRLKKPEIWDEHSLTEKGYFILTLHRPSNVDLKENLVNLLTAIMDGTRDLKVIFPVHPRTHKILKESGFNHPRLIITDPKGYLEFIYLVKYAKAVITDSGGITEEATVLGVPCLTLRTTTERPETCTIGTNELIGTSTEKLLLTLDILFSGNWKKGGVPTFWDGQTSKRIVDCILHMGGGTNKI